MTKFDEDVKADLIATAHALADAARPVTLKYFRSSGLSADNKDAAGFDPVTRADREAEQAMRAVLAERRPDDGIYGEEFGQSTGTSGFTWVLDPIDGTRGYICGTPTWGVLIGLNQGAGPIYGIVDQPHIGERFSGGFGVAKIDGPRGSGALEVRETTALSEALVLSTFPEIGTELERAAFHDLSGRAKLTRYGMDCYGYMLLAAGQVDLVVEAGLLAYDIQGPMAVIEAAGGVVTNWQGGPAHDGGQIIAAGSKELHEKALKILAGYV